MKRASTTTKMKVAKVRAKPKTFGVADLKQIHYAMTLVLLEWQTEHFSRTASCEADE